MTGKIIAPADSPPADEMHELDGVPVRHHRLPQPHPADDLAVPLHHDRARIEPEELEELEERHRSRHTADLTIDGDRQLAHVSSAQGASRASAAAAESGARQSAAMAATPQAPASRTASARAASIPPIAITGRPSAAAARTRPRPAAGR